MENSSSQILLELLDCEESLYKFIQKAWPAVEGNNPFVPGWHAEAICEHLEACVRGEIKRIIISLPPRTGKTGIISVMWPAWIWTKMPNVKFLFSSYSKAISLEHSRLCRMLLESPWYKERWGHIVKLSSDQSAKGHFTNTATGHRISTSVRAGGTALGGDVLVCLPANSIIETSAGKLTIGDIVENEMDVKVFSYNHQKYCIELDEIEKYEKRISEDIYEIEFDDGTVLECTGNHPVFSKSCEFDFLMEQVGIVLIGPNYGWDYIDADCLKVGDVVMTFERED